VIVLNELVHKLIIGEVAQKMGLKPGQVIRYLKRHGEILETLEAYEVAAEVETSYGLTILGVTAETFSTARRLMQIHRLLSNDALHLAVMQEAKIWNLVTNDTDFDKVEGIQVWKPEESIW
jgi:predicted nucleic acid-binding protein